MKPCLTRMPGRLRRAAALACLLPALALAQGAPTVEWRAQLEDRVPAASGPLAEAQRLVPGLGEQPGRVSTLQAELRHTQALAPRLQLGLNLLARHEWPQGALAAHDASRVNELQISAEAGAWGFTAGKKQLGWDVGYAFRPNDVVQQEERRSLAGTTPEGRPLLQAEWFGTDRALALVWVNPQARGRDAQAAPGAGESAFALRAYQRVGSLDLHGVARQGDRTGASLGLAAAWVPADSTEWHASVRALQRHEAWASSAPAAALLSANPWQQTLQGRALQALAGVQWTGSGQQTLLAEAWRDGTAPSADDWRQWQARNAALVASSPAPAAARAGNLVWQATPLAGATLQRNNVLLRLSWQPPNWQLWADALWQPADGGQSISAGLQWQGAQWRVNASWRRYGGAAGSVMAQLPWRQQALLAATLAL